MIIDALSLPPDATLRSDFCIVGAGPAGLALAKGLSGSGYSVCLLEAGGLEVEEESQELARVRSVGDAFHDPSDRRTFALGGSTWLWSGWCRPFDPVDFAARAWVPHSGWPISYQSVAEHFPAAASFLGLADGRFDLDTLLEGQDARPWDFSAPELETSLFRVLEEPPRLGIVHRPFFSSRDDITIYLHARAQYLHAAPDGRTIAQVSFLDAARRRFTVHAERVVLAAGGIDNARLLLACRQRFESQGLVIPEATGRFFMLRLHARGGEAGPGRAPAADPRLYNHEAGPLVGRVFLSAQGQEQASMMRYNMGFVPNPGLSPAWVFPLAAGPLTRRRFVATAGLAALGLGLGCRPRNASGWLFHISHTIESAPNPASRVALDHETDAMGLPRAVVDWRTLPIDRYTFYGGAHLVASALNRWGRVRVNLKAFGRREAPWPPDQEQGIVGHFIGTTRMGGRAEDSVVDPDCRVHGFDNLYVAGSSVFPTSGNGTPTLTLVALALRLAAHLRRG